MRIYLFVINPISYADYFLSSLKYVPSANNRVVNLLKMMEYGGGKNLKRNSLCSSKTINCVQVNLWTYKIELL